MTVEYTTFPRSLIIPIFYYAGDAICSVKLFLRVLKGKNTKFVFGQLYYLK